MKISLLLLIVKGEPVFHWTPKKPSRNYRMKPTKRRRRTKLGRKPKRSRFSQQRIADLPPTASGIEVARILGCSYKTLLGWIEHGAPARQHKSAKNARYTVEKDAFVDWLLETKRFSPRPY